MLKKMMMGLLITVTLGLAGVKALDGLFLLQALSDRAYYLSEYPECEVKIEKIREMDYMVHAIGASKASHIYCVIWKGLDR